MRLTYFDFLRGISILMVISIHTFNNSTDLIDVTLRNIMNCAVPIFLAISGYFLGQKLATTTYKELVYKQIPKVYIPCLIFSIPLLGLSILGGKSITYSLMNFFLCGFSVYYFIALIIQYYLLLPLLTNIKWKGIIICAIISILSIGIIEYLLYFECIKIPLLLYAGGFPVWIIFFTLGIYCRKTSNIIKKNIFITLILLVFISLILSVKETYFLLNYGYGGYGQKVFSFIFNMCMICLLFSRNCQNAYEKLKTNVLISSFVWIGRKSFFIYLIHCYFISYFIAKIPFKFSWFTETIIVMALSIISVVIAERLPKKIQHYIGV